MAQGNVFKNNPEKLQEMLDLYNKGYGLSELGRKYGVGHSSIYYWIKGKITKQKRSVKPFKRYNFSKSSKARGTTEITQEDRKKGVLEECKGKNYIQYLNEYNAKQRKNGGKELKINNYY